MDQPAAAELESGGTLPRGFVVSVHALRVLVVDDQVDSAQMLSLILEDRGYTTRVACDGPSALAMAVSFQPHVGLLDLALPGMNGFELATRLRALPGLSHVRLVAVTGHGSAAARERARAAGFDEHFMKPVDLRALDALLDDARETL
jgi:CheY-like chemotaxis protein